MSHQIRTPLMATASMNDLAGMATLPGFKSVNKFGYNLAVGMTIEDVICQSGTYVFPSDSGEAVNIVSDNAADIGMTILVRGLDENFDEKTETVVLNGTTDVALSGLWTRFTRAQTVGSTVFAGEVNIFDDATGVKSFVCMNAADQITTQCVFTIPNGNTGFIKEFIYSVNDTGGQEVSTIFRIRVRPFGSVFVSGLRIGLQKTGASILDADSTLVEPIPEKSDIKIDAVATATNIDVSAAFAVLYINNDLLGDFS